MSATAQRTTKKAVVEQDDKNEVALCIISFIVVDCFQGLIRNGKTTKDAQKELQKILAFKDKQKKYSLIKRFF